MKKYLLGLALAGLAFSCKSTDAEVNASAEAAEMECCSEAAAECADSSAACSDMKKSECSGEAKVCPVTGKTLN